MKFEENGNRRVYNIDVDGTLTNGEPFWETEPTPNDKMIAWVRELYSSGSIVIIHTARLWEFAPETVAWLIKHHVPYHGLFMAKGGSDQYVDDKSVSPEVCMSDMAKNVDDTVNNTWGGDVSGFDCGVSVRPLSNLIEENEGTDASGHVAIINYMDE